MYEVTTSRFVLPREEDVRDNALFLHRHLWTPKSIIMLVHGLSASPYETWQNFPKLLFEDRDLSNFDVGLFKYDTTLLRWNVVRVEPARSIEDVATEFADVVRDDLKSYQNIVFLCHSLGGIVTKSAIRRVALYNPELLGRIRLLMLLGTPNYGSTVALLVPALILFLFSREIASLRVFSPHLTELQLFWNTRIRNDPADSEERILLNERAVVSTKDRLVPRGSGVGNLPDRYLRRVNRPHTCLAKPRDSADDIFLYVKGVTLEVTPRSEIPAQARRHRARQLEDSVSRFFLSMRRMAELYHEKQKLLAENSFRTGDQFDMTYERHKKETEELFFQMRDSLRVVWEEFPDGDVRSRIAEFAEWYHALVEANEDVDVRPRAAGPQRLKSIVEAIHSQTTREQDS